MTIWHIPRANLGLRYPCRLLTDQTFAVNFVPAIYRFSYQSNDKEIETPACSRAAGGHGSSEWASA